jgi:hypothetical protein
MAISLRQILVRNTVRGYQENLDPDNEGVEVGCLRAYGLEPNGSGIGIAIDTSSKDGVAQRIVGVADPVSGTDAANKRYVDGVKQGIFWKDPVRVASTSNVNTATPGASIDGVTLANGDRVLLKDQTNGAQNGIWVWKGAAVAMVRAEDGEDGELRAGTLVPVNEGTINKDTMWWLTSPDTPIIVGTTATVWNQFKSAGDLVAGRAISIIGNTIKVMTGNGISTSGEIAVVAGNGITVGTNVAVKAKSSGGLGVDSGGVYAVAGDGISVGGTGISAKAKTSGGLGVDSGGIHAVAGNGISVGANISAVVKSGGGLAVDSTGLSIALAATNSGLSTASGLAVGAGNGIAVSGATVAAKVKASAGLTVDTNGIAAVAGNGIAIGTGISAKAKSAGGLAVDSGGIYVDPGNGISVGTKVSVNAGDGLDGSGAALKVKAVPDGGIKVAAAGLSIPLSSSLPGLEMIGTEGSKVLEVRADRDHAIWHMNGGIGVKVQEIVANPRGLYYAGTSPNKYLEVLLKAGGGLSLTPDGLQVDPMTNIALGFKIDGVATNATVTAAALNELTAGLENSFTKLHAHQFVPVYVGTAKEAITFGDPVYTNTSGEARRSRADDPATALVVGISLHDYSVGEEVYAAAAGYVESAPGDPGAEYWLAPTGGLVKVLPAIGNRMIRVGLGTGNGLVVQINDFGE